MDRKIAFMLALAMRSSDLGKWNTLTKHQKRQSGRLGKMLGSRYNDLAKSKRYKLKDKLVVIAATEIHNHPDCGFYCEVKEYNESDKVFWIVSFNFAIESKARKIEFHSFDKRVESLGRSSGSICCMRDISREACISMMNWLSKN